jgi:hypothetical protein
MIPAILSDRAILFLKRWSYLIDCPGILEIIKPYVYAKSRFNNLGLQILKVRDQSSGTGS